MYISYNTPTERLTTSTS